LAYDGRLRRHRPDRGGRIRLVHGVRLAGRGAAVEVRVAAIGRDEGLGAGGRRCQRAAASSTAERRDRARSAGAVVDRHGARGEASAWRNGGPPPAGPGNPTRFRWGRHVAWDWGRPIWPVGLVGSHTRTVV